MRKALMVAVILGSFALHVGVADAVSLGTFTSTQGSVSFDLTGTTLTKTITNIGTVAALGDVLTGLVITFSTAETFTLTGGTANGTATCTGTGGSTVCTTDPTDVPATGAGAPVGATSGSSAWTASGSGTTTETLKAGGNADLHPGGIVNQSIVASGADGLGNDQHIPYFLGPVTLTNQTDGNVTITGVTFLFGTEPTSQTGTVPEPATLLLLGFGLAGATGIARWRQRRRD